MSPTEAYRMLLRRWYVVVAGVVGTAVLVAFALGAAPPTYQASARVLLLPPTSSLDEWENPLLHLDGLVIPAEILTRYLSSGDMSSHISQASSTASYAVTLDPTTSAPVLLVNTTDVTAEGASDALQAVLTGIPTALDEVEDRIGTDASARMRSLQLVVDASPTIQTRGALRAVLVSLAAGLGLTMAIVYLVDRTVAASRRRARSRRRAAGRRAIEVSANDPAEPAGEDETITSSRTRRAHAKAEVS